VEAETAEEACTCGDSQLHTGSGEAGGEEPRACIKRTGVRLFSRWKVEVHEVEDCGGVERPLRSVFVGDARYIEI